MCAHKSLAGQYGCTANEGCRKKKKPPRHVSRMILPVPLSTICSRQRCGSTESLLDVHGVPLTADRSGGTLEYTIEARRQAVLLVHRYDQPQCWLGEPATFGLCSIEAAFCASLATWTPSTVLLWPISCHGCWSIVCTHNLLVGHHRRTASGCSGIETLFSWSRGRPSCSRPGELGPVDRRHSWGTGSGITMAWSRIENT